jgi:hypothetical protein
MNQEMMAQALRNRAGGANPQAHDQHAQAAYEAGKSGVPFDQWITSAYPQAGEFPEQMKRQMAEAYQQGAAENPQSGGGGW